MSGNTVHNEISNTTAKNIQSKYTILYVKDKKNIGNYDIDYDW